MNSVFITGTITAGKSHLANKLSASLPIQHISTDELWESVKDHPEFKSWYNYFWNKDEAEYYRTTSPEQLWQDIVDQSEAIWPIVKQRIAQVSDEGRPAIFEGVSLLPHLMHQISMKGVVLLALSEQQIFERLQRQPRWSDEAQLQRVEAHVFFTVRNRYYESEAKQYGYPAFQDPLAAEVALLNLIQGETS